MMDKNEFIKLCRNRYGNSAVGPCTLIYKKVIQDMNDNVITKNLNAVVDRDEIINIAMRYSSHDKYTIHSVGTANIRCLHILGLNVQFMLDDLDEYKNFTDVYIKKYTNVNGAVDPK